jgi:hypothetical protein
MEGMFDFERAGKTPPVTLLYGRTKVTPMEATDHSSTPSRSCGYGQDLQIGEVKSSYV